MQQTASMLVYLDGRRILNAAGEVIAQLAPDGAWYTPGGLPCEGLTIADPAVVAHVDHVARAVAARASDTAWLTEAMRVLTDLAETRREFTSDDLWAALTIPPREPRMIGNAFAAAQQAGLIERTRRHRPSTKPTNHQRPVRIWRSLRHGQRGLYDDGS